MTKRLIDLDDDLLSAARDALGTDGITDTVRSALQHVVDAGARAEEVAWLSAGSLEELASRDSRADVWR